jgi:hypothetical protein
MTHRLPSAPDAPVIEWTTSGGLADAGGAASVPDLRVTADGTVTVGPRLGGGRAVRSRLSPERLDDLLREVLDQHAFFTIDATRIGRALEAAGAERAVRARAAGVEAAGGPPYPDAGTTRIAVAADGRGHEVELHGLFAAAREHPEIRELADARAIEVALLALAQEVAAAGA